jgi:hypothetical protein
MDRDDDDRPIFAFHVPSLPRQEYPKERRVRRIIERNRLRGRKTWVFTELTGRDRAPFWDYMDYLADYLRGHGISVEVLRSNNDGGPKPEDREEWIEQTAKHVDVVISNPSLVQTGLDLYDFPSIVFAFCGDNTYRLRQASRRAWRLGQKYACEVDYVVYGGQQVAQKYDVFDRHDQKVGESRVSTARHVQEAALSLMASKMEASLAIEGDFSAEGLVAMSSGEDMASQLAKFIDGRLDALDPAKTAFEKYRAKLEACLPDLGTDVRDAAEPSAGAPPTIEPEPTFDTLEPETPQIAPPAVSRDEDEDARQAAFDLLRSLGIDPEQPTPMVEGTVKDVCEELGEPEPAPPAKTEAEQMFEQPALAKTEPSSVRDRKAMRLRALCEALGQKPDESNGDRHRFGDTWYQLVAKRRATVRERNFTAIAEDHEDAMIAFVEPTSEVGPTVSNVRVTVSGVEYVVSTMFVNAYLAGERTPGGVAQPQ